MSLYQALYEEMVRFVSEGDLLAELQEARTEYTRRTGELFESDPSFERRIAAFLEWYALDRPLSFAPEETPLDTYLRARGAAHEEADRGRLMALKGTTLSLFEFKRAKNEHLIVVDLLTNQKLTIFERRKLAGLESGDVLEARIIPFDDKLLFSDAIACHPRDAKKAIAKAAKKFRKAKLGAKERVDLVHRVAFFSNRCERYKHVSPKKIFAELETLWLGSPQAA